MITVGGLSVAVVQRHGSDSTGVPMDSGAVVARRPPLAGPGPESTQSPSVGTGSDSGNDRSSGRPTTAPGSPRAQLSFNGGVGELDDASIQALLGALDEIDRAPIAPSVEPDRSPVLPVIKDGDR
jgi:hypothetical protein